MTRVFNFVDDHDDNIFAFLMTYFVDFAKGEVEFDQKSATPFAKLIFDGGDSEILFYELPEGFLGWWDEQCGEIVLSEKEMEANDLILELVKLVR